MRRGTTILELVVASLLVATMLTLALEAMSTASAGRRRFDERQLAIELANDLVEQVGLLAYDDLKAPTILSLPAAEMVSRRLAGGKAMVEVIEQDQAPRSKHVVIVVRWNAPAARAEPKVRFSIWVHPPPERREEVHAP